MKIGLIPVNVGVSSVERMLSFAETAEQAGIESLWTFEHVMVPVDYRSKYPYSRDGKMGATPETNLVDPLVALSAIAARTTRIRLGTGVNILPQANPLYLAKQAASLDFISKGRFILGVGIGWLREEYDALGVPFERRGERFEDYVVAMRKVWTGDVVEHESEFVHWTGFKSHPVPSEKRGVPIVIGGSKGHAFARIAKHGDGWFAPASSTAELAPMLAELDAACAAIGRDRKTLEISCMWFPSADDPGAVDRFAELGVTRLIVPVFALGMSPIEGLARFVETWSSKLERTA